MSPYLILSLPPSLSPSFPSLACCGSWCGQIPGQELVDTPSLRERLWLVVALESFTSIVLSVCLTACVCLSVYLFVCLSAGDEPADLVDCRLGLHLLQLPTNTFWAGFEDMSGKYITMIQYAPGYYIIVCAVQLCFYKSHLNTVKNYWGPSMHI